MTGSDYAQRALFAELVRAFRDSPNVTLGSDKGGRSSNAFGSSALRVNNKIFAMLSSKGSFVVKLPRRRVDEIVAGGYGQRFDPGHGRLTKEWCAMNQGVEEQWLALAREALEYVASGT